MDASIARAGLTIGGLMLVTGGVLLPLQQPGTAEFVITVTTVVIGLLFTLGIILAVKISRR